jgi:septum formation protein
MQAGFEFRVHAAHIDETLRACEEPIAYVTRLAREKAEAVYDALSNELSAVEPGIVVLGADTTVVLDAHILGKPEDAEDAKRMLRLLSGRTHRVITGVSVMGASGAQTAAEVTAVQFLSLSDAEIDAYVATGEPNDKAGAYAIQGRAARWIPRIDGCYFNVVGLPISLVSTLLDACLAVSRDAELPLA